MRFWQRLRRRLRRREPERPQGRPIIFDGRVVGHMDARTGNFVLYGFEPQTGLVDRSRSG